MRDPCTGRITGEVQLRPGWLEREIHSAGASVKLDQMKGRVCRAIDHGDAAALERRLTRFCAEARRRLASRPVQAGEAADG